MPPGLDTRHNSSVSLARVLLAGTLLVLGVACRPKPASPSPEKNPAVGFRAQGSKELTLDGIDFFAHDRGLLIGDMPGGAGIAQRWRRLRDEAVKVGRWPVLMFDGYVFKAKLYAGDRESPEAILAEAAKFDREHWLSERRRRQQQSHEEEAGEGEEDSMYYLAKPDQIERFAKEVETPALTELEAMEAHLGSEGKPITVALLPTQESWKVYAYIPNELQPRAETSTGILKSWHERYGAEVVMMTDEELCLWVPEPVTNKEELCRLAEEQFFFCPELVDTSGSKFAANLRRHRVWSFWWD